LAIALLRGPYLLRAEVPRAKDRPLAIRIRPATWTVVTLRYLVPPSME